jgi:hypothetical protein
MARAYHVDGPVLLLCGTGAGSPAALEEIGICEDGVDLMLNFVTRPVQSDAAGAESPSGADLQDFGQDATIRGRLKDYDLTVLQKLRALAMGNATEGLAGAPGRLIASSGGTYRLVLRGADEVWRFTTTTLRNGHSMKLGTKAKAPQVEFYSWRFVPAGTNTVSGVKLYDHTDA